MSIDCRTLIRTDGSKDFHINPMELKCGETAIIYLLLLGQSLGRDTSSWPSPQSFHGERSIWQLKNTLTFSLLTPKVNCRTCQVTACDLLLVLWQWSLPSCCRYCSSINTLAMVRKLCQRMDQRFWPINARVEFGLHLEFVDICL